MEIGVVIAIMIMVICISSAEDLFTCLNLSSSIIKLRTPKAVRDKKYEESEN